MKLLCVPARNIPFILLIGVIATFVTFITIRFLPVSDQPDHPPTYSAYSQDEIETRLSLVNMPFVENGGQALPEIKYYSDNIASTLAVTETHIRYLAHDTFGPRSWSESFVGNDLRTIPLQPSGSSQTQTKVAYFKGSEPKNWHTAISTFEALSLGEIWENIDVEIKSKGLLAEKYFYIKPGGAVSDIRVALTDIDEMYIDETGNLHIFVDAEEFLMSKPVAYQSSPGNEVAVNYALFDEMTYGFEVGNYDTNETLTIDPILYSTFFGSDNLDFGYAIESHEDHVYISGGTASSTFLTEFGDSGGYETSHSGDYDHFVARFDSSLTQLESWTLLGGTNREDGASIKIQDNGNVFVAGTTNSADFPTTPGAYDTSHNGNYDFFLAKLSPDLSNLLASTYIGGSQDDQYPDIDIDSFGNIFIGGTTASGDYPFPMITVTYDSTCGDDGNCESLNDLAISKISNDLSSLIESTYLGGTGRDENPKIDVYDGAVYASMRTTSTDFPFPVFTSGADQTCGTDGSCNSTGDTVVTKINTGLSTLIESTYYGGEADETSTDIFVDSRGVFIIGTTQSSSNPPVTGGAFDTTYNGSRDGYVAKFNSDLDSLETATLLGGSSFEYPEGIQLDSNDNVFVVGRTLSNDFPTVTGVYDETHNGSFDFFVSRLNANLTDLTSSTYVGGDTLENFPDIILDEDENVVLVGSTDSVDSYPVTPGAFQETYDPEDGGSYWDVIITVLDPDLTALALDHFKISGLTSQTPGTSQQITITAYGNDDRVWTGYTGDHSIIFSGASTTNDGSTPTCTNKDGTPVSLGEPTILTFTDGAATCELTLYAAESVSIDATDGQISTFGNPDYDLDVLLESVELEDIEDSDELADTGRMVIIPLIFGIVTLIAASGFCLLRR